MRTYNSASKIRFSTLENCLELVPTEWLNSSNTGITILSISLFHFTDSIDIIMSFQYLFIKVFSFLFDLEQNRDYYVNIDRYFIQSVIEFPNTPLTNKHLNARKTKRKPKFTYGRSPTKR